jgi:hypothetical protein
MLEQLQLHQETVKPVPTIENCSVDFPSMPRGTGPLQAMGLPEDAPSRVKFFAQALQYQRDLQAFAADQGLEPIHGVYISKSKPSTSKRAYPRLQALKGGLCPNGKKVQHIPHPLELETRRRVKLADELDRAEQMMERDREYVRRWMIARQSLERVRAKRAG